MKVQRAVRTAARDPVGFALCVCQVTTRQALMSLARHPAIGASFTLYAIHQPRALISETLYTRCLIFVSVYGNLIWCLRARWRCPGVAVVGKAAIEPPAKAALKGSLKHQV